ncbi:HAD-IA family hydrolase [Secundilactobacillus collinoides]|nr:HAD-IA family hydrolase [Secundilactobacillus collinoides]KZL42656.1 hypothetical protein TY91_04165 [Secundilactobacillus collinoides]
MQRHTFFWDFDGTLFDTYPIMVQAFMQALLKQRVSEYELDEVEIYEVMRQHSLGTALSQFSAQFSIDKGQLERDYRAIEPTMIDAAQPFDGMVVLLQAIHDAGGLHLLLTHRDKSSLKLLETAGIKSLFEDFVTKEQPFERKPNPGSLNYLIEKNNVDRATAIMVGDRTLDIDAGHNAGIAGALFDPHRVINAAASHPEIDVTDIQALSKALLA